MKLRTSVMCLVLLLAVATVGHCQWWNVGIMNFDTTARWSGMGGAGIAAANDSAALDFNPANLAVMQIGKPAVDGEEAAPLGWEGSLTYFNGADVTSWGGRVAVVDKMKGWGAGASWERVDGNFWTDDIMALGAGMKISSMPLCVGISGSRDDWSGMGNGSETWLNAGALYTLQSQGSATPIKLGAVVSNILNADDDGVFINLGVALPVAQKITLAADWWDITNQWGDGSWVNVGAEAEVAQGIALRAGCFAINDSDDRTLTLGAGYKQANWSLDAAWIDVDDGSVWGVTGSMEF